MRLSKRIVDIVRAYAEERGCTEYDGGIRFVDLKGKRLIRILIDHNDPDHIWVWDTDARMGVVKLDRRAS